MAEITRMRTIAADPQDVWDVLADFAAISDWAANVDHSCMLQPGPGGAPIDTTRRVQSGRNTLVERIVTWEAPDTLAYEIEGLPRRLGRVHNRWDLMACGAGSTRVDLTSSVAVGPRPPQQLVGRIVCRVLAKQSDVMLTGLANRLEQRRA